ncbi:hypothetical protein [Pajaroellobacter abortibovis]|nr:hypothetical protein [Pajaroellobacter abortibovis]
MRYLLLFPSFSQGGAVDLSQGLLPFGGNLSERTPHAGVLVQGVKREVLTRFEPEHFASLYAACGDDIGERVVRHR